MIGLPPTVELSAITREFPSATGLEIANLWDAAPAVLTEWIRWDSDYPIDDTHPNMQAARLLYVLYALTPYRNRRRRECLRLSAMQIMLPCWNFPAYRLGK